MLLLRRRAENFPRGCQERAWGEVGGRSGSSRGYNKRRGRGCVFSPSKSATKDFQAEKHLWKWGTGLTVDTTAQLHRKPPEELKKAEPCVRGVRQVNKLRCTPICQVSFTKILNVGFVFLLVFFFLLHEKMDSSKRRAAAKSHSILVLQLIASVTARLASRSAYSSVQQAARGDPAARSPRAFWEGVSTDSTQTFPKQCPIKSRDTSIGRLKPDCRNLSDEASPSARAQPGRQLPDVHLGESFPKCVYADSSWCSPFKAIELTPATEQLVIDERCCFVVICSVLQ